ncbi:MAG: hypothetical protein HYY56_04210, partial [Candidatus Omnitrophica bacterium]|nr:hypothetical protein [Candidatus Omnitrophota bacterium]
MKIKKTIILIIILGLLNVASGLSYFLLALSLNIFALIAGIFYILFSISVFKRSANLEKKFYFINTPLTILCLITVVGMAITFGSKPPYGIDTIGALLFICLPVTTWIGDIYFLKKIKTIPI